MLALSCLLLFLYSLHIKTRRPSLVCVSFFPRPLPFPFPLCLPPYHCNRGPSAGILTLLDFCLFPTNFNFIHIGQTLLLLPYIMRTSAAFTLLGATSALAGSLQPVTTQGNGTHPPAFLLQAYRLTDLQHSLLAATDSIFEALTISPEAPPMSPTPLQTQRAASEISQSSPSWASIPSVSTRLTTQRTMTPA